MLVLGVPIRSTTLQGEGCRAAVAGDVASGLEQMERATDLAPWRARYWLLRTDVLAGIGDYQAALRTAEHAAEKDPGNSHYAVFAARIADQLDDQARTRRWCDEALARNPHSTG